MGEDRVNRQQESVSHWYLRTKDGTLIGRDFVIPQSHFGRFMGFDMETREEKRRKKRVSGGRVVELAINKAVAEFAEAQVPHNGAYIDLITSWMNLQYDRAVRSREKMEYAVHAHRETADPFSRSLETHHMFPRVGEHMKELMDYHDKTSRDSVRHLELQYKLMYFTKSFELISDIMRIRHDGVMKAIRGER